MMSHGTQRSRRSFLRALAGIGGAMAAAGMGAAAAVEKRRPNVVIILADDQGTLDLNCYGSRDLYTPNLDMLASRGVRFTQFYMGAPVCSPSRGALLTGRDCNRNGVANNAQSFHADETTMAEMLKAEGYATALIGKWHLGHDRTPREEGFDYFFGHMDGCIDNFKQNRHWWDTGEFRNHDLWRNEEEVYEEGTHFGDLLVREACAFFEAHKDDAFFLYLPFNSPHYPVQPLPHHLERYKDVAEPRRSYAAFISTLDEQVGKVVDKLDALGLRENTLLIFMSDHGHSVEGRNNLWLDAKYDPPGGGNAGPYRGHKFTLWEGGMRVPAIASWPGVIPENEVREQVASSLDWFPTVAKITGAKLPEKELDGKDLSAVLAAAGAPTPHPVLHRSWGGQWFVREGDWKLVGNGAATLEKDGSKTPGVELFLSDFTKDVSERINLAEQYPDKTAHLKRLHEAWAKKIGLKEKKN